MPSKKYHDETYHLDEEEEEIYSVDIDEEGNPYINPDLHELGMDHEKIEWMDSIQDDITHIYTQLIEYRDSKCDSHFLEKVTFNKFLIFVAQNSYKVS
tara:strand:- start:269 stop:562 length:294 start_codon:yes stop_codon:yes gene_type:complete